MRETGQLNAETMFRVFSRVPHDPALWQEALGSENTPVDLAVDAFVEVEIEP